MILPHWRFEAPAEATDDEVAERLRPHMPPDAKGFDFALYHRARFSRGIHCPRCGGSRVQSWGRFGQRRRFRCSGGCGRTFSTFTGTPLAYVKRVDLWPAYLECVRTRCSTRRTARLIGCHRDTAFRWRHRLLAAWVAADRSRLSGRVALGQIWFAHSQKGERGLARPPRRRGSERELLYRLVPRVWVILAREIADESQPAGGGRLVATSVGVRRAPLRDYEPTLRPRLDSPRVLVCPSGPLGPGARLARLVGAAYERPHHRAGGYLVKEIWMMWRGLRAWLMPFRGVATKYLEHYLRWFAIGDPLVSDPLSFRWLPLSRLPTTATACSNQVDQQFPRTEHDGKSGGHEGEDGGDLVVKATPDGCPPQPAVRSSPGEARAPPWLEARRSPP